MTMTERLLEATKEIWDGYNETPFVKGIADGSLDHEKFKYYMIQDYLYLLDYTKVFSIGTAKAKNLDAPELPPHRLRSCQDCRIFPESQWRLSIGCFLFCILRDDRTIRAIPFGRSALLHCAITFFCRSRCRSQNDKPAVPLSGEIEAFFLESDPSSASTALRMSVFQVRIFHGACIPAVTPAPPIGFQFSRNLHFFNYHKTSVSFSDHTFFHSKKPFMT